MSLFFGVYDGPGGGLIGDYSGRATGLQFSTNAHGYASLAAVVPLSVADSFRLYDRAGMLHAWVTGLGATAWEGRIEDVAIVDGGVRLQALGYWRALSDVPYTGLWSTTSVADWEELPESAFATSKPKMYAMDTNNRLFWGLTKGTVYGNGADVGALYGLAPAGSDNLIKYVSFTYEFVLPAINWRMRVSAMDADRTNAVNSDTTINGTGGPTSFTWDLSATPRARVEIQLYNYSGSGATYSGESGANYLRITAVRLKGTTSSSVYADEIARGLVTTVNGVNAKQLQAVTVLIESPGIDLRDEVYEDRLPVDILMRLAGLGDNQTPPRQWEVGVFDNRLLHFRPRGSVGRAWFVDVSALEVERTIEALRNSVYGVYRDESKRTQRTAASTDTESVQRYGVTRRQALAVETTSATQAGTHRDAALQDGKDPTPRSALKFGQLYDALGSRWPAWLARSGDTITIRNLPPTLSAAIDRVRTFRIAETTYTAETDTLEVTPESPLPRLEVMVAREALNR